MHLCFSQTSNWWGFCQCSLGVTPTPCSHSTKQAVWLNDPFGWLILAKPSILKKGNALNLYHHVPLSPIYPKRVPRLLIVTSLSNKNCNSNKEKRFGGRLHKHMGSCCFKCVCHNSLNWTSIPWASLWWGLQIVIHWNRWVAAGGMKEQHAFCWHASNCPANPFKNMSQRMQPPA